MKRINQTTLRAGLFNPENALQLLTIVTMTNNKITLTIDNTLGLHARPAALFVQTANKYDCEIKVGKDGNVVNGKSIMGLMMLAAAQGNEITIEASGKDADKALQELVQLVKNKFGEED